MLIFGRENFQNLVKIWNMEGKRFLMVFNLHFALIEGTLG